VAELLGADPAFHCPAAVTALGPGCGEEFEFGDLAEVIATAVRPINEAIRCADWSIGPL
jgi:hypothetical protein